MKRKMIPTQNNFSYNLLILLLLACWPEMAWGGISFTPQASIKNSIALPQDVAAAADGRIFVADAMKNQVLVYRDASLPIKVVFISQPCTVAASHDGRLYIGSNADRSVIILDSSYKPMGYLGKGANEFQQPCNIVIDRMTGKVYVIDQLDQCIKVYTAEGGYLETIDDFPNLPQDGVIVDHKLYILDQPPTAISGETGMVHGARVRVFDLSGINSPRSFGSYGLNTDQMFGPRAITADKAGYLYIIDSFHGVVQCYDSNGTYQGAIFNSNEPMNTPLAAAFNENNRLYVASSFTSDIKIFDITSQSPETDIPKPDIRVNGEDGPVVLAAASTVAISIDLAPGDWDGEIGDWWVAAQTPKGWYWYKNDTWNWSRETLIMQTAPLVASPAPAVILESKSLTPGSYIFYFAVDTSMNDDQNLRGLFFDRVQFIIK